MSTDYMITWLWPKDSMYFFYHHNNKFLYKIFWKKRYQINNFLHGHDFFCVFVMNYWWVSQINIHICVAILYQEIHWLCLFGGSFWTGGSGNPPSLGGPDYKNNFGVEGRFFVSNLVAEVLAVLFRLFNPGISQLCCTSLATEQEPQI